MFPASLWVRVRLGRGGERKWGPRVVVLAPPLAPFCRSGRVLTFPPPSSPIEELPPPQALTTNPLPYPNLGLATRGLPPSCNPSLHPRSLTHACLFAWSLGRGERCHPPAPPSRYPTNVSSAAETPLPSQTHQPRFFHQSAFSYEPSMYRRAP